MILICVLTDAALLILLGFAKTSAQQGSPCSWDFCDVNAVCTSLSDTEYSCECKPDYAGDGRYCKWQSNLPEPCASNPCDPNATCRNLDDSYFCSCKRGYDGDGIACTGYMDPLQNVKKDIPPCFWSPCHADATCTNLGNSIKCLCNRGYVGDGKSCIEYMESPQNEKKASRGYCSAWKLQDNQEYFLGYCGTERLVGSWCCVRCRNNYRFRGTSKKIFDISCKHKFYAEWSPKRIPSCEAITCPKLSLNRPHVVIWGCGSSSSNYVGRRCTVKCISNYKFFNSNEKSHDARCQLETGSLTAAWTKVPDCIAIKCPRLSLNWPHVVEPRCGSPSSNLVGSKCTVECTRNYKFSNSSKKSHDARCQLEDGSLTATWSTVPECIEITCSKETLTDDRYYNISNCPGGRSIGSICTLQCIEGYKLDDDSKSKSAVCTVQADEDSASWGLDEVPKCIPITCRKLPLNWPHIVKSSCGSSSTNSVGSRCTVECTGNYKFSNSGKSYDTQCRLESILTAAWSSIPKCIAITCQRLSLNRPHVVKWGCGSSSSNYVGRRCTVECISNYKFFNSNKKSHDARCQLESGSLTAAWTTIPNCIAITCPKLALHWPHVVERRCGSPSSNYVGSKCKVECAKNYKFSNSNKKSCAARCQLEGGSLTAAWTTVPDCIEITCSEESITNNGNIGSSDCPGNVPIGSKCILQCMDGYKFSDDSDSKTAVCKLSDDGGSATWGLEEVPLCIEITCSEEFISDDENYDTSACRGDKPIDSECSLQCKDGYKFGDDSNSKTAVCTLSDDGKSATWGLDDLPKCIPVTCPKFTLNWPHVVERRCGSSSSNYVGSKCKVECARNYRFSNSNKKFYAARCQLEGGSLMAAWTTVPNCVEIECGKFSVNSNQNIVDWRCRSSSTYSIGSTCSVQCKNGYKFSNSDRTYHDARCQLKSGSLTAAWSSIPDCEITCGMRYFSSDKHYNIPSCPSGKSVGSKCRLQCKKGYKFNSDVKSWTGNCELSGSSLATWNMGDIPECIGTSCDFEDGLCQWEQDSFDDFDWERTNEPTPSTGTGPPGDHTASSGYYLYIETSSRHMGDTARLISPILSEGPHCLEMWYHMHGDHMGSLLVKQITGKNTTTLVKVSGEKGNIWLYLQQNIVILDDSTRIAVEGVRGSGYRGDLAIDDIILTDSLCTRQNFPWTKWGRCTVSCGGGTQSRSRNSCASNGVCSKDMENRDCNPSACPECKGEWTSWFDRDNPSGNGDYEDLSSIRKGRELDICFSPSLIDGRVVRVHTNWYQAGNKVTVAPSTGLTCVNRKQKNGIRCKDYEVRFCCPKIKNRKEVQFVAEMFSQTVLSISGGSGGGSSSGTSNCKRRNHFDSGKNIKMLGKDCSSGRRKRGTTPDGPVIKKRDVLFLIDASGSVGDTHFKTFKRLALALATLFCGDIAIGKDKTRVGIFTFDKEQHVQLDFKAALDQNLLENEIDKISYNETTSRNTCLIPSLEFARTSMFTPARGARIAHSDTEQVIILLSDGCANCKPSDDRPRLLKAVSEKFTQKGVSIIT